MPNGIKIVKATEDSSVINELKKIKELQMEKASSMKELNEKNENIEKIHNKIKSYVFFNLDYYD